MKGFRLVSLKPFPAEAKMRGQKNEIGLPSPVGDDLFERLSKMNRPFGVE